VAGTDPFRLGDYPGFLPGLGLSLVLATIFRRRLAVLLGTSEAVAWLLVVSLGVIAAATLTPGGEPARSAAGSGACDISRIGPATLDQYATLGAWGLNVLLFVPLGVAAAQLPRWRVMILAIVGGVLLPAAIEAVQLVATPLARACQAGDVVDNLMGFAIGFAAGSIGGWMGRRAIGQRARAKSTSQ
jgi:hypothetical protein